MTQVLSRRDWLLALAGGTAVATGCVSSPTDGSAGGSPRLTARPRTPTQSIAPGAYSLNIGTQRDGVLYVPASYRPDQPAPLVVMLHGAGGGASGITQMPVDAADNGALLLVPESRMATWDVVFGGFGPDIEFIDRALNLTFSRCAVRPDRIGLFGFSDGASYALSVGLANGDLFSHTAAFAPGYLVDTVRVGRPRVFVGHGRADPVLPFSNTRNNLVPTLRQLGYEVEFMEFDGGHSVYPEERKAAFTWFKA